MRTIVVLALIFITHYSVAVEGTFSIHTIGASNNSNTIFIETVEDITGSTCSNKRLIRLPDTDKQADRLYSMALAAKLAGKRITVNYDYDGCFDNGTLVQAFRLRE